MPVRATLNYATSEWAIRDVPESVENAKTFVMLDLRYPSTSHSLVQATSLGYHPLAAPLPLL